MRDKTKKVTTVVSKVIIDLNFNEYHTCYLENLWSYKYNTGMCFYLLVKCVSIWKLYFYILWFKYYVKKKHYEYYNFYLMKYKWYALCDVTLNYESILLICFQLKPYKCKYFIL